MRVVRQEALPQEALAEVELGAVNLARPGLRTVIGPLTASRSNACIGWPSSSIT